MTCGGRPDYQVRDEGTIVLWWPLSPAAKAFREEFIEEDAQTWNSAIVVDHRMWPDLFEGLTADGLVGRQVV